LANTEREEPATHESTQRSLTPPFGFRFRVLSVR
jgi:hypothetical protein